MSEISKKLSELSTGKSQALDAMRWRRKNRWWIRPVQLAWIYGGWFRFLIDPLIKYTKYKYPK